MHVTEARELVVELLRLANIYTLRNRSAETTFVSGEVDFTLDELDMDSLAQMELCIALEVNIGMAIVPEDLPGIATLGGLAHAVLVRRS